MWRKINEESKDDFDFWNHIMYISSDYLCRYYILSSPINGNIETEKMGDGNYLDKYFEMKYWSILWNNKAIASSE